MEWPHGRHSACLKDLSRSYGLMQEQQLCIGTIHLRAEVRMVYLVCMILLQRADASTNEVHIYALRPDRCQQCRMCCLSELLSQSLFKHIATGTTMHLCG